METNENWLTTKNILVVLAHPDDPEFFLGGSIARWIKAGHHVRYVLLTRGDKGSNDPRLTAEQIAKIRIDEQRAAAEFLGVISVDFLGYEDGYLIPDLEMRKAVVRFIRKYRPQILVAVIPKTSFPASSMLTILIIAQGRSWSMRFFQRQATSFSSRSCWRKAMNPMRLKSCG